MKNKFFIISALILISLSIYLFKSAPERLVDSSIKVGSQFPVRVLFQVVAAENAVARAIYTSDIVGKGKKVGLEYSEKWKNKTLDAGPLPALLLREVSRNIEKSPVPLGLFLGSDFPIASANKFSGSQVEKFNQIRADSNPAFFYSADIKRYVAMFPDYAVSEGCVTCHNDHPDSPKKDWKLHDIMGATTWLYPDETVSLEEIVEAISVVRAAISAAYMMYLEKCKNFQNPPEIGDRWPEEGYFIPNSKAFLAVYEKEASLKTMQILLSNTVIDADNSL
ncbi:MAG: DUF3365 domain-containing protein [Methylomarinum sp.]|nr:DUF3365 domain-containing protein [Methylomarinum sp.]